MKQKDRIQYTEDEAYNLWSLMTKDYEERIEAMKNLFLMDEKQAIKYDQKFKIRREKRIWENTHPLECSRVYI